MKSMLDPEFFWKLGHNLTGHNVLKSENIGRRRFVSLFGVSHNICSIIWRYIEPNLPNGSTPSHLLWALLFLKNYNTEEANRAIIKSDEKTIRKWIWVMIDAICRMRVVI